MGGWKFGSGLKTVAWDESGTHVFFTEWVVVESLRVDESAQREGGIFRGQDQNSMEASIFTEKTEFRGRGTSRGNKE